MKKYLLTLLILLFTLNSYSQEGELLFKIKANHYYQFNIKFKGNCTQYLFRLNSTDRFNFRIIEPSGNEWQLYQSEDNQLVLRENIYDEGIYTIKIYSISDNIIRMIWEEY